MTNLVNMSVKQQLVHKFSVCSITRKFMNDASKTAFIGQSPSDTKDRLYLVSCSQIIDAQDPQRAWITNSDKKFEVKRWVDINITVIG